MRRRGFEGPVWQRHQGIITEEIRRFLLHDPQDADGKLADLGLGVTAATQFNEMPQSAGIGRHENLGFRGVGQDTTCGLTG